jgi:hypothetical protein
MSRATRIAFLVLLGFSSSATADDEWRFHCEAEKGSMTAAISRAPTPLDAHLFAPPRYSPDPLGDGASIRSATVRLLGSFGDRRVVEARLEVSGSFYTDYYVLLCEAEPGRYLPIYGQQYNRGTRTPELTSFGADAGGCSIRIMMRYSGTGVQQTTDEISLSEDPKKELQLRWERKA